MRPSQARFRELFDGYDSSRRGYLGAREVGRLVRDLVPGATDSQVRLLGVLLDVDGDGRVTHDEFLATAKSVLAQLSSGGGHVCGCMNEQWRWARVWVHG
jgi:Ca2+-binding EF-hand superfamily protein